MGKMPECPPNPSPAFHAPRASVGLRRLLPSSRQGALCSPGEAVGAWEPMAQLYPYASVSPSFYSGEEQVQGAGQASSQGPLEAQPRRYCAGSGRAPLPLAGTTLVASDPRAQSPVASILIVHGSPHTASGILEGRGLRPFSVHCLLLNEAEPSLPAAPPEAGSS